MGMHIMNTTEESPGKTKGVYCMMQNYPGSGIYILSFILRESYH